MTVKLRATPPAYPWYARLPLATGALGAALRRHTGFRDHHLATVAAGAYRDVQEVLSPDGDQTGLIVKRTQHHNGGRTGDYDLGNATERTIYAHVRTHAPQLLAAFPVLYETAEDASYAIHERVICGARGTTPVSELERRLRTEGGIDPEDLHGDNIGRRYSTRGPFGDTVFLDYGHFALCG